MFSTILSRCAVSAAHYTKSITALRQFSSEISYADLVKKNKVVVFMKGTPDQPRCGYSKYVVHVLRCHGIDFDSHDVLSSKELREGMKSFSDWPTFPQVYMNGEFIGGCDIIIEMHRDGSLIKKLESIGITSILVPDTKTSSENE